MSSIRRNSSEYSGSNTNQASSKEEIEVDDQEKSSARSHLYGVLFSDPWVVASVFPPIFAGATPILLFLFFGKILNQFTEWALQKIANPTDPSLVEDPLPKISMNCLYIAIIAVVGGIAKFFEVFSWIRIGSHLSTNLRRDLFRNMMKCEVTFFDKTPIGAVLTLLAEDAQMVQDSFGTVKGRQIASFAQFLTGIILAYIYSWKIALIATAVLPVIAIFVMIFIPKVVQHSVIKLSILSKAMTIAEESLASIRTVRGFNKEEDEIRRFRATTLSAADHEITIGYLICGMMGSVMVIVWGTVIGNMFYGAHLVEDSMLSGKNDFLVGDMMSCFMFTMMGTMGLMMVQGSMQGEQKAITAGARILKLAQHQPEIPFEGGITPSEFKGHIEFKNVTFRYPTRDVDVLKNISFEVLQNHTVALVGHSGSGKSTCIQLLERYYDINEGMIMIDGKDIKEYDPRWLHRKIGLVSQEPTLFATTIKENIIYGVDGASDEEIARCAEVANAKKFIEKLSDKYETMVGEKGCALSGGQKQRVAIARAVIKDPSILLCDEATSALDAGSERKVQEALDKVMIDRTCIIVAHRLSTIKNAHKIYVFETGEILEEGTHDELVAKNGVYYNLVSRQLKKTDVIKVDNEQVINAPKEEMSEVESSNDEV